jgi:hypothetical protein
LGKLAANLVTLDLAPGSLLKVEITKQAQGLEKQIADSQRRLEILAAQLVSGRNDRSRFERARRAWERMAHQHAENVTWWREIVEALVEEVTVDLEAGTFVARVNLRHPALADLVGDLWEHGEENETTARPCTGSRPNTSPNCAP